MRQIIWITWLAVVLTGCQAIQRFDVGTRPQFLVSQLPDGELKEKLTGCLDKPIMRTRFSIGHRGAPLFYPEHTKESYIAAAKMGAGTLECDVTFTKDKTLVCRHAQCDLHATTDILLQPKLASKCRQPFTPANPDSSTLASAQCCTSDITLAEFKQLKGKMDGVNRQATTVAEFVRGTPYWRTDLYASSGTLMTHSESIALFKQLGVNMTPELKAPEVPMPFEGLNQSQLAQKMLNEYSEHNVPPSQVFPQSFSYQDIQYWIKHAPEFANHAVFLDGREAGEQFDINKPSTWQPSMEDLVKNKVKIIAPPIWMLISEDKNGDIIPSQYALAAKRAGLKIIAWSLERSGPLANGGGWYYQSVKNAVKHDGDILRVLDILTKQVGVVAVFSDWPATTSFYASCMGIE
ncbi:glycerophosphodiester phosphodiesterase family protein [Pseudoalteromonas piscicida]|uniref:glycerophosphodiester phosphodiesterase family protein n=1 Tax=Pseudoalteromonas piscicida TaxID=43662 RepID=UPI000E35920C|nr:glycerophosphodiester phosphodiesterase family protein [Pseudoalteromonas piscicida]AXQ97033.1 glycerophosphodiester phosphodiesterase [Pseudoalteromonas piscicida]